MRRIVRQADIYRATQIHSQGDSDMDKELIEKYASLINSVYLTGSFVVPWIENSHDRDYVIFVNDIKDARIADLYKEKQKDECFLCTTVEKKQNPKIFSYERYFEQIQYGDFVESEGYFIFDHKDEYKQCLVDNGLGKPYDTRFKFWYHILTGIYLLDNGEYELTDEQIANVRLCHDKQMTQEIYDYIQKRLLEYKNELDSK